MHSLIQDVRYAARALHRNPGFATVAVVALALGIGANTAVFTVVDSVLLRPLPFPEPERLLALSAVAPDAPFIQGPAMPDRLYLQFRKQDRLFEKLAAFNAHQVNLSGAGDAASVQGAFVTADFFAVLRARPALGRTFAPDEDQPGRDKVVVLSDKLWRANFASSPAVIGKSLKLDGVSYTVIGVMPEGFAFPAQLDLWAPNFVHFQEHQSLLLSVIGRLKPGIAARQAVAELDTIIRRIPAEQLGPEGRRPTAQAVSLLEFVSAKSRRSLMIFLGAVAFVLLIACANVANLMLARAAGRRREIAVRAAMGASRRRLMRQLLVESTLVALVGGAAGLLLALWGVPLLLKLAPGGTLPRVEQIGIDGWVLAFTLGLSLATGIAFGILPALQATRSDVRSFLSQAAHTITGRHELLRGALVVSEIALALILLAGAGLLLKSFLLLRSADPGFRAENLLTMSVDLPDSVYRTVGDMQSFHRQTLEQFSRLPGVMSAATVNWLPMGSGLIMGDFHIEGRARPDLPPDYMADKPCVSPGYFRTMGIRLVRGRDFDERDNQRAPGVVILSQSVARRFWRNEDPIGKRITMEEEPKPEDWLTIVGVAEDVKQNSMADKRRDAVYQPIAQIKQPFFLNHMAFVVRTASDPEKLAPAMRAVVRGIDRNQPVQLIASMQDLIARTTAEPRFQMRLLGAFSILALILAAVGIYGVLAYSVAQRTQEIGIRMALGAERQHVLAMVLRRIAVLAAAGLLLGTAGALAVTRVLARYLFEVKPADPTTFAAVAALLAGVALLAGLVPARRATRVDPMVALRYE